MPSIFRGSHYEIHVPKKYFIVSDLHLEFRNSTKDYWEAFPRHPEAKVCICAGDFTSFGLPARIVADHFIGLIQRFDKVIYVPGNHEYYGSNPTDVDLHLHEIEYVLRPTLKVLRAGEPYEYDGQRFVGDTMWFPDKPEVHIYRRMINDSVQIKDLFPWCFTQSHLFLNWIKDNLRDDDIVITHHVPNDVDTLSHWKNSPTQAYFMNSDCQRFCLDPNTVKPRAWIYGHTHDKHDYNVHGTRFICNPVGYPGEKGYLPEAAEPAIYEI